MLRIVTLTALFTCQGINGNDGPAGPPGIPGCNGTKVTLFSQTLLNFRVDSLEHIIVRISDHARVCLSFREHKESAALLVFLVFKDLL